LEDLELDGPVVSEDVELGLLVLVQQLVLCAQTSNLLLLHFLDVGEHAMPELLLLKVV